ncbi:ABC transporter ATP-binding protein [Congregibacter brevis]|uniref:ABC transporter ATP-binding protein n=1 Tax=Congregibacter brevis TaxID=3081201 RepID=A0ABZ0IEN3_9GAMM|nr:ABC transporter ATP-binding protein [Congregibacter sp. IMCC45268]
MIDVKSLTRYYGKTTAVEDLSFSIEERQVVGLLGHNGAGKTTVMKMLSGFLEPTAGSVQIGGKDLNLHARELQRSLGYLPENLPIYPEMSIADYLDYAAHLKGLRGDSKRRAIRYSVDATELGDRFFDPIGQLSRGFKQRVGVAQAILGEPDLLILDEPANGLDPQQNEHMRDLVRELSTRATVILSTHIMQEVDALCERVLVLSNGSLALDSPLAALRESRELLLTSSDDAPNLVSLLTRLPQIADVATLDAAANKLTLTLSLHESAVMDTAAGNISRTVIDSGAKLYSLTPLRRNLEQIFREAVKEKGVSHGS